MSRCLAHLGGLLIATLPVLGLATDDAAFVPATAPRTTILAGRAEAFRAYCLTGEGARAFAKLRADLDARFLALPFPAEPLTYGDPAPGKRTSAMADQWRAVQDVCGTVAGVAEAAVLAWRVTGEERYLAKAREFLLGSCRWHFDPDWRAGAVPGATDIAYNDEAHFRLWRKLPLVYDQLRDELTPGERALVLDHFRERGRRSVAWIEQQGRISQVRRNSIASELSSHPVRFMPMTGLSGLALWDDLPEAREWWAYAYRFYRDQFSPWGGDDGGWAEGNAYWRGTFEHAAFQDALLALGDPLAYATPFWRNSPYFALYLVQPYRHTTFGDTSNAGHFNLEPVMSDYLEHLARVLQDGWLRAYAALGTDPRPRPVDQGLGGLGRTYPTAAEFLVRNFLVAERPLPAPRSLAELPPHRFFADIGWVTMHSALGRPDDDIHLTFKSSPYGSFSHSHADQNSFILNAYGEGLAINSAYREYHNSPHHQAWTRQTLSKNAVLIDGRGQQAQSKAATGALTRFVTQPRYAWATGDATAAYATLQPAGRVRRVTRDVVFIDQRYVVLRDRVVLATPGRLSWLLHAEENLAWDAATATATIRGRQATLTAALVAPGVAWRGRVTAAFPVPVDPKYARGEVTGSHLTGGWRDQQHLTVESEAGATEFTVYAILWPGRGGGVATARGEVRGATLTITRPDGRTDVLTVADEALELR